VNVIIFTTTAQPPQRQFGINSAIVYNGSLVTLISLKEVNNWSVFLMTFMMPGYGCVCYQYCVILAYIKVVNSQGYNMIQELFEKYPAFK